MRTEFQFPLRDYGCCDIEGYTMPVSFLMFQFPLRDYGCCDILARVPTKTNMMFQFPLRDYGCCDSRHGRGHVAHRGFSSLCGIMVAATARAFLGLRHHKWPVGRINCLKRPLWTAFCGRPQANRSIKGVIFATRISSKKRGELRQRSHQHIPAVTLHRVFTHL